jgi:bifunctional non-homologous end joining protein LigD
MQPASLPQVELVRPTFGKKPFLGGDWSFEFKYDGFRGLYYINGSETYFLSRQKKVLHQFDILARDIALSIKTKVQNAIFDGELITKDSTGRPLFSQILNRKGTPSYVAFDLLWLNGLDLRGRSLKERRKTLNRVLPKKSSLIEPVFSVEGNLGEKFFDLVCEYDVEGVVAKQLSAPYNKSTKWYKIKNPNYSQAEGRKDFFNAVRRKATR